MVIRPTTAARLFIEQWIAESKSARYGDVDQDSLMLALGRSPWVSFGCLPVEYCATTGDKCKSPIIFHSSASANDTKISKWKRRIDHHKWPWAITVGLLGAAYLVWRSCW